MEILRLEDVKYQYKGRNRYILNDINVELESGKIYVIIGKAGSGKSSLLAVMSGLDSYTSGKIKYKNKDLKDINKDIYRNSYVGSIFKDYNLLSRATVLDNILLPMSFKKGKEKNKTKSVNDILNIVGIDKSKLHVKVENLLEQDKKKIYIAKALCNNPDLIISDDIIENCDETEKQQIIDIFIELAHKYNKCVVLATNSYRATSYADELWGMNNGKLMFIKSRIKPNC